MVPSDDLLRLRTRLLDLERENLELRSRVERAREMVTRLHQRLAFLEGRAYHGSVPVNPPPKQSVTVHVGGEELSIRSEHPPEYTREVAAHYDDALRRIRAMLPTIEAHKAAILAGLAVTDELFRARRSDEEMSARIATLADEVARLLPPAKRGQRGGPGD